MINGTVDLDAALASLKRVLTIVEEEKSSVEYTKNHAALTGKILSEHLPIQELIEYAQTVQESTSESQEDVVKVLTILNISAEILDHYVKLSEIGSVWEGILEKSVDSLRCYQ